MHPLLSIRRYQSADLPGIVELLKAAASWPPAVEPSIDQIERRWKARSVKPNEHVHLLDDGSGKLKAYWVAAPFGDASGRLGFDIAVHPAWRKRGIGAALLTLVEAQAGTLGATRLTCPVFVPTHGEAPVGAGFLEKRGYRTDHGYWQMRLDAINSHAVPVWPQGISVRAVSDLDRDAEIWCRLVFRAFGEEITPQAAIAQMHEPGASPDSYFFAVDSKTGLEVGTSRGRIDTVNNAQVGYIGTVGVLPDYRHRGIAQALVRQTLAYLSRAGVNSATLFVERQNHAARHIYDAMGWSAVYRTDHYWKPVSPARLGEAVQ